MKYVVGLLATVLAVSLAEYQRYVLQAEIILTEEQIQKLLVHHKACLTVPSRGDEFAGSLVKGVLIDDQQFKEYLFCISKRIGFQNDAGDVNKELIIEKLRKSVKDPSKAEEYVDTCLAKKTDSPIDTAIFPYNNNSFREQSSKSEIFTEEQIKGLLVHHKPCLTVPTRGDEFGERLANLDLIDDEQLKNYLFCVSKRIGFQNEAGDTRKEVLVEMIRNSKKNTSKAEEYIDICLANKNDSPTDTIYKIIRKWLEFRTGTLDVGELPKFTTQETQRRCTTISIACSVSSCVPTWTFNS
ncbi:hypothetical protein NQ318_008556 [Aromia moschata]|uniref:Uncharacterized protein n=1 Tax=Aromia moschata TaxID=1265417 RepID=A0AAV8YV70_9CUCU|nr:hypothetical protein NQ318_008556 [Aromia moschata]